MHCVCLLRKRSYSNVSSFFIYALHRSDRSTGPHITVKFSRILLTLSLQPLVGSGAFRFISEACHSRMRQKPNKMSTHFFTQSYHKKDFMPIARGRKIRDDCLLDNQLQLSPPHTHSSYKLHNFLLWTVQPCVLCTAHREAGAAQRKLHSQG